MSSPHPPDVSPDAPGLPHFIVKLKSQLNHETRYNALVEKLGAKWQHDEPAPKWTPTVDESVVTRWQVAHHRNLIDETQGHEPPRIVDLAWTRDRGKDIHAEMADDETDGYSPPWQHDAGKTADTWEGVGWKEQAAYLRAKTAERGVDERQKIADILAWLTQQAGKTNSPADSNQDAQATTDADKATPDTAAGGVTPAKPDGVMWQDAQAILDELRLAGGRYTSLQKLADKIGYKKGVVHKAIKKGPVELQDWASKQRPASRLNLSPEAAAVAIENTAQSREPDPANMLHGCDVDVVLAKMLDEASPDERARIHGMTPAEKRQLAEIACRDPDEKEQALRRRRAKRSRSD